MDTEPELLQPESKGHQSAQCLLRDSDQGTCLCLGMKSARREPPPASGKGGHRLGAGALCSAAARAQRPAAKGLVLLFQPRESQVQALLHTWLGVRMNLLLPYHSDTGLCILPGGGRCSG